jgi:hypothetical protein
MVCSFDAGIKDGDVEQQPVGASPVKTIAERGGDDKKIKTGGRLPFTKERQGSSCLYFNFNGGGYFSPSRNQCSR